MPTYAELNAEACWRAQFTPPALQTLAVNLRARYSRDGNSISSPGDNRHLGGAHRSRRWIRESRYCTNRTYTVSHADDQAGDENWYSAIDIGLATQSELLEMCKQLDDAVRAGLLEEIAAWYGNVDGDQRVDGYDNILDRLATSDTSHLTHLHITFKRRYANDAPLMARVFAVLTGTPTTSEDDDMYWIGKDDAGRKWVGNPTFRRQITDHEESDLRYHASTGRLALAAGVWGNLSGMGPVRGEIDYDRLATALAAKLPAATLTTADVRAALAHVLTHGTTPE